jgi:hypothetical protein
LLAFNNIVGYQNSLPLFSTTSWVRSYGFGILHFGVLTLQSKLGPILSLMVVPGIDLNPRGRSYEAQFGKLRAHSPPNPATAANFNPTIPAQATTHAC